MNKNEKGFTLLELMITIAILGILAAIAAPNFSNLLAKNKLNNLVAEWRSAFYLAQKEAIRTKSRVELCPSTDGISCAADRTNYSVGWIVYDHSAKRLIRDFPVKAGDNLSLRLNAANGAQLNFLNNGRLPSNFAGGNFEASSTKLSGVSVKLVISRAGRIH